MNTLELPEWSGQVALITGGARGLGKVLAERLLAIGVKIWILDLDASAQQTAQELSAGVKAVAVDVTDESEVNRVVQQIYAEAGRIDILANCAGVTGQTNRLSHEVDAEDFDRVMRINVNGCFYTSKAVIPFMLERGYGRILHVASISGKEGNAGMLAYSTSKAAVIGLTKVQGKEYAETGVRVNAIAPAVIRTDMVERMPEEQVRYMTDKIPTKRCATLQEFAAAAEFIVSPQNSFTTGFCFDLSGGRATY